MSRTRLYRWHWAAVIFLAGPGLIFATQQLPSGKASTRRAIRVEQGVGPGTDFELAPEAIAAMELGLDFRAIKDRPFRAEMVVETDRRLPDGNTLHRRTTQTIYRDHTGRLRQERTIESARQRGEQARPDTVVSIKDPNEGVIYVLNPNMKIGFRLQQPAAFLKKIAPRRTTPWSPHPGQDSTTVVLGNQLIEGLDCEGKIDTITIPAGTTGNTFSIEIVTERWHSPDLQIDLVVKHNDPRSGETTITLKNVNLDEPPESLFEVPAGYEIRKGETTAIPLADEEKP